MFFVKKGLYLHKQNNKDMTKFDEITAKLNKMFKGSEEQKDKLISDLKYWLKTNRKSEDKEKVEAFQCFLEDKHAY